MTLKEIIEKENAIIKHEQFFQDTHIVFTDDDGEDITIEMLYCDDTECIEESLEISKCNLEYHQQLVDYIKELETFRKQIKETNEIYNKALDDFADELKWLFSMYYTGSLNSKDVDDIVKELKKGTEND